MDRIYEEMKQTIHIPNLVSIDTKCRDTCKKVNIFDKTLYNSYNRIRSYKYRFPSLSVNLPFKYYSEQYIPSHIYEMNYGIDIKYKGINIPLFAQIQHGKIISADDLTYFIIMKSAEIGLPYIPITLYMMNNRGTDLISDREIDIANKSANISEKFMVFTEELDIINKLCYPYLIFYNKLNLIKLDPKDYRSFTLFNGKFEEYDVIDFYLQQ